MVQIQLLSSLSVATFLSYLSSVASLSPIQDFIEYDFHESRYDSDLTRDIFVKQIHSHNDYWRDAPLYTALSYGVQSVEADVWYFEDNGTLYVGHHLAALNSDRTFKSLYIDPLVSILDDANPKNNFTNFKKEVNGVFDTSSGSTLYLFVDVKTNGNSTWPIVEKALEPLREKNYLSYFNGTDIVKGPVTVIGTGNTPYEYVAAQKTRDYFFDGPLNSLNESFPYTLNPIASGSLKSIVGVDLEHIAVSGLNDTQIEALNATISNAHSKNILTRIWEVSWWPVAKRNALTRQIIESGSDFLNADDLKWASTFDFET